MKSETALLTRLLIAGLMSSCLNACAKPSMQVVYVPKIMEPPPALLEPCQKPSPSQMETNGDLAKYASDLLFALDKCIARVDALRAYFDWLRESQEDE